MALLAEALVDEWLNRQGFFTIRGLKDGVDEIDLLGVRPVESGLEGWHVEVQMSVRPIGYICKLTPELCKSLGRKPTSAAARSEEIVEECARAWVERKFNCRAKRKARESAWAGVRWTNVFVHGAVREPNELTAIADCGLTLVSFHRVMSELCTDSPIRGAAATDIADLITYYETQQ